MKQQQLTLFKDTPHSVAHLSNQAREFLLGSKAPNTIRGYRADLRCFIGFCGRVGTEPLPATPETLDLYLTHLVESGKKYSAITRRVAAINHARVATRCGTVPVWGI